MYARNDDLNEEDRPKVQNANYKLEEMDCEGMAAAERRARLPGYDLNAGEQTKVSEQDALDMDVVTEKAPTKLEVR